LAINNVAARPRIDYTCSLRLSFYYKIAYDYNIADKQL